MTQIQTWLGHVHDAVLHRQWWMLASLALMATVAGLRMVVPKIHGKLGAWFNTEHGAIVLVFATAILGAFGTALGGGVTPTLDTLWRALAVGMASAVSYPTVRKFLAGLLPGLFGDAPATSTGSSSGGAAPARALLPFLPLAFLLSGCLPNGYCKDPVHAQEPRCKAQTETVVVAKVCGEPALMKLVGQIFPQVVQALISGNFSALLQQLVDTLKSQGVTDALTAVTCAVQTVQANGIPPGAAVPESTIDIKAHAKEWNAAHPLPAGG